MICTIQMNSLSGNFGSPYGTDVRVTNISGAKQLFKERIDTHDALGCELTDAHALVWKGAYSDVTDLYPDFEWTVGPRGGVHSSPC
jgi:hypothetical protein